MLLTFEPGDTPVGRELRRIVLDPATGALADRTEVLLYAADKAEHVDTVVRPALDRGQVVVTDRYVDSTLAYQGAGRALDVAEVERRGPLGDRRPAPAPHRRARPRPRAGAGPLRGPRPDRGRVAGVPPAGPGRLRRDGRRRPGALPRRSTPGPASRRSPPPCASGSPPCSGGPRARCPRDTVWDGLVGQHAAVEALRRAAGGRGDEPLLAVHRAAGLRALERRDRLRRRPAVRARRRGPRRLRRVPRLPHRAGRLARRRLGDPHREALDRRRRGPRPGPPRRAGARRPALAGPVVEDADRLTDAACNALLKAIEEPTDRTVWMLCAPTVDDVLPTIRSRCRLVTLTTPTAEDVAGFLVRTDGRARRAGVVRRPRQPGPHRPGPGAGPRRGHPQPAPRGGLAARPGSPPWAPA